MEEITLRTEPAIKPAEPDTKPKPKRRPRPKREPDRNDPWVVPKPKVNPTPKGKIMNKLNKNSGKKEVIDDIREFRAFSAVMTHDAFFAKYTLSMRLVAKIGAAKALAYSGGLDREATLEEKQAIASGNWN